VQELEGGVVPLVDMIKGSLCGLSHKLFMVAHDELASPDLLVNGMAAEVKV
jgi:hypothetical protein